MPFIFLSNLWPNIIPDLGSSFSSSFSGWTKFNNKLFGSNFIILFFSWLLFDWNLDFSLERFLYLKSKKDGSKFELCIYIKGFLYKSSSFSLLKELKLFKRSLNGKFLFEKLELKIKFDIGLEAQFVWRNEEGMLFSLYGMPNTLSLNTDWLNDFWFEQFSVLVMNFLFILN